MPPVDPSNGCLSIVSLALETHVPDSGQKVAYAESYLPRFFVSIIGIPRWLTPLRDRSGPSWLNASTWSERPKYS